MFRLEVPAWPRRPQSANDGCNFHFRNPICPTQNITKEDLRGVLLRLSNQYGLHVSQLKTRFRKPSFNHWDDIADPSRSGSISFPTLLETVAFVLAALRN